MAAGEWVCLPACSTDETQCQHSPAKLGDDHLGAKFVELVPQVFILQPHLDARVRLAPRQPRRRESSAVDRRLQVVGGEAVGKGGLGGKAACGNTRTTVTLEREVSFVTFPHKL